ncbi:MAG: hypothetical protein WBN42_06775 [Ignavibacteriaceae bacterium]
MNISERKAIDLLVNEFWRLGFLTISRRLGIYLPEPENVGNFQVDIIGRQKEKYAIGITLSKEAIYNFDLLEKINYLASRKSRSSGKSITLFIGVDDIYFKRVKELLLNIDEKIRRNIKLVRIEENNFGNHRSTSQPQQIIFS